MTRHLEAAGLNVRVHPTALHGQDGRPGWPEATQARAVQLRAIADPLTTCGHPAQAMTTVHTRTGPVRCCRECVLRVAERQDSYITPDGDDAA